MTYSLSQDTYVHKGYKIFIIITKKYWHFSFSFFWEKTGEEPGERLVIMMKLTWLTWLVGWATFWALLSKASAWQWRHFQFSVFWVCQPLGSWRGLGQLFFSFFFIFFYIFISCNHDAFDGLIAAFSVSLFRATSALLISRCTWHSLATFGSNFGWQHIRHPVTTTYHQVISVFPESVSRKSTPCTAHSLVSIGKPF